jgi:hypothetical protein
VAALAAITSCAAQLTHEPDGSVAVDDSPRPVDAGAEAAAAARDGAPAMAPARDATVDSDEFPSDCLRTDGKGASWVQATEGYRTLLAKLDWNDALVRQYRHRIVNRCRTIGRIDGFTSRTVWAVRLLTDMLTDLSAKKTPFVRYAGQRIGFTYWSNTTARIETILIQLPPGYDPQKDYQLFIYYKCGGGIIPTAPDGTLNPGGGYRPAPDMARKIEDTFHAWSTLDNQIKGRLGGEVEVEEASAALAADFSVNPDRVFLSGWSDGGYTALWIASRFPHLVAGIAPNTANWQYQNVEYWGLTNVPLLMVDGWADGGYIQVNFLRWQMLASLGADASGIVNHNGHAYTPYETESTFTKIMDWARSKRRNLWPKRVRYATWNLLWHRAFWLSLERMTDPQVAAWFDAQVKDGNRIEVQTRNVAAFTLSLSDKLVDPGKPVVVVTDGHESYRGAFKPEVAIELVPLSGAKFVKSPALPGDILGVTAWGTYASNDGAVAIPSRRWLAVRPTGDPNGANDWYPKNAKADTDVTADDIANYNLKLYGGPEINRLTAKIAGDLAVRLEKGKFSVGARVFDQPGQAVKFIHPNPLNPQRYVMVNAFNDLATARMNGFYDIEQGGEFRTGDCLVYGNSTADARNGVLHYVFDSAWRAPQAAPVGQAAARFDMRAVLRLEADAIREATGVPAALVFSAPPPWNTFHTSLPAGPVTTSDIAMTNMFPEYVEVGDLKGDQLQRAIASAGASSLAPNLTIDPAMTYHVAVDYRVPGNLSFSVDATKIPADYFFSGAQEFQTNPAARLPIANLTLTNIDFTEAVARYFQKNGTVGPR